MALAYRNKEGEWLVVREKSGFGVGYNYSWTLDINDATIGHTIGLIGRNEIGCEIFAVSVTVTRKVEINE